MKYFTSALVIAALFGATNAINLKSHSHNKDDFMAGLVEDL